MKLTDKQTRMLRLVNQYEGEGTCEIELQWGDYDLGGKRSEEWTFWITRLVVSNLIRSLIRKGLVREAEISGYELTEAGRVVLATVGEE